MIPAEQRKADFDAWMEEMGFSSADQAAKALGKSIRIVEYYRAGQAIPLCVLYLMEALQQGYKPSRWRLKVRA